jgi:hypothetical protein
VRERLISFPKIKFIFNQINLSHKYILIINFYFIFIEIKKINNIHKKDFEVYHSDNM